MTHLPRTLFITGADRGLGLALAEEFLRHGLHVFAGIHSSSSEIRGLPNVDDGRLTLIDLDVSVPESIRAAAAVVDRQTGSLDILVNNAGVHLEDKRVPLEDLDLDDGHLERSMAVNGFGPLRVVQAFLPLLEEGESRRIVNVTSEAGSIGACWRDREFAYSMSKCAANMATRLLSNYLGPRGYGVLAVHPGWIRSEMGGPDADLSPAEAAAEMAQIVLGPIPDNEAIYIDHRGNNLPW